MIAATLNLIDTQEEDSKERNNRNNQEIMEIHVRWQGVIDPRCACTIGHTGLICDAVQQT
jgi:hypothetical protein